MLLHSCQYRIYSRHSQTLLIYNLSYKQSDIIEFIQKQNGITRIAPVERWKPWRICLRYPCLCWLLLLLLRIYYYCCCCCCCCWRRRRSWCVWVVVWVEKGIISININTLCSSDDKTSTYNDRNTIGGVMVSVVTF